jgi:hypothetical protein
MPVSRLQLSDNAGLGLARAIAVAKVLRADPRLVGASVLPLSGAQLIMPGDILSDGKHAGDVETRRRIEIRVRRRSPLSASPKITLPPVETEDKRANEVSSLITLTGFCGPNHKCYHLRKAASREPRAAAGAREVRAVGVHMSMQSSGSCREPRTKLFNRLPAGSCQKLLWVKIQSSGIQLFQQFEFPTFCCVHLFIDDPIEV